MAAPRLSAAARDEYRAGRRAMSGTEQRSRYQAAIEAGRGALAQNPSDPGALLWLAASLGAEALTHGKLRALGVIPEMESLLLRLDETAPGYEHAAAARTLARLYQKAPAFISIGSSSRARRFYERALALAPDFPGNLALAADFFSQQGDDRRAIALARRAETSPGIREDDPDAAEWREITRRVLTEERR